MLVVVDVGLPIPLPFAFTLALRIESKLFRYTVGRHFLHAH